MPEKSASTDAHIARVTTEIVRFVSGLAQEGERILVIGGAARVDVALERLLKASLHHNPGGEDNLFDQDRPLGTFSAKISLAYRMGLLDSELEHALQHVRKLRNAFAHADAPISLSDPSQVSRAREIVKSARKFGSSFDSALEGVKSLGLANRSDRSLVEEFTIAVSLIASVLEAYASECMPVHANRRASLDHSSTATEV